MNWIAENWLLLAFGGGMLAMHLFGHGHGGKKKSKDHAHAPDETSDATFEEPAASRRDLPEKPVIELASATEQDDFTDAKPKV